MDKVSNGNFIVKMKHLGTGKESSTRMLILKKCFGVLLDKIMLLYAKNKKQTLVLKKNTIKK
jgi:hypothetical protein